MACHWDHRWIKGTPFEQMRHVVLLDFAIHWLDICTCFMNGKTPKRVFATAQTFPAQSYEPPSMASVILEYAQAQACLHFHGHVVDGQEDSAILHGSEGTLRSRGMGLNDHTHIDVFLSSGHHSTPLEGSWFEEGFQGTMGELLCAIEEDRDPSNSAASTLPSLATTFAAMQSADTGLPVDIPVN